MATAQAQRTEEMEGSAKPVTLTLQAIPRKVGELSGTIEGIGKFMNGKLTPVTVKIGNAAIAEDISKSLTATRPEQYITSVTKKGDLRILNASAVVDDLRERVARDGHATRAVGSIYETGAIAERLKPYGIMASLTQDGTVRALDIKMIARQAVRSIDQETLTNNVEIGTRQEAEAVAKFLNEQYKGKFSASANDNGSIDVTKLGAGPKKG